MKIVLASLMHESNTFSANTTTFDMWIPKDWLEKANRSFEDGLLAVDDIKTLAKERDIELTLGLEAFSAGPKISADCYKEAVQALLLTLQPHKDSMDGLLLGLHGGAAVEGMDDVETDILKQVRSLIGDEIPIAVPMDLHGNIGEDMSSYCNIIVGFKEYPHTDIFWTFGQAFNLLVKTINKDINPVMAITKIPMMLPPAKGCTMDEPMKSINEFIRYYAAEKGLVDVTFFHGFPFSDIPCSGSSVVVVADGSKEKAQESADEIASYIWEKRSEFIPSFLSSVDGMKKAVKVLSDNDGLNSKPIIINETSDNPGGGAPCDGTHTLKELLAADPDGACFGCICDPEVAEAAHRIGEGGEMDVLLGAKTDSIHGSPLPVHAKVIRVTDGIFIETGPLSLGVETNLGPCTRLKIGNVDVLVSSKPCQLMGEGFLRLHDIDVTKLRLLCIKSSQHFRAFYQPISQEIITVDPPGIHTSNLHQLQYNNLKRPIYPLDEHAVF